jgi:hypothetical protein
MSVEIVGRGDHTGLVDELHRQGFALNVQTCQYDLQPACRPSDVDWTEIVSQARWSATRLVIHLEDQTLWPYSWRN